MTDTKIYAHTYWSHNGKYPDVITALQALVPVEGEVPDHENNPALEQFRIASNCYHDLYNNGLCNMVEEFHDVFGFDGPEHGQELTPTVVRLTEDGMDTIIIQAAIEQGITIDGYETRNTPVEAEVPVKKPFVQLTGEDGNVFAVMGRVSRALKNAGLENQAEEFVAKAMSAKSYDEVLRLCTKYCDVS